MARDQQDRAQGEAMRPLTKQEIDRRIEYVVAEVAAFGEAEPEPSKGCNDSLEPRWITPGELVRRMRRFTVYN